MINKCHPSWQAKQLNSINPSNKTWFKCFFLFSSQTITLFLHLMMLREAFRKRNHYTFFRIKLLESWFKYEVIIFANLGMFYTNNVWLILWKRNFNCQYWSIISCFWLFHHNSSFIQKENKLPILFIKKGNVAVYWLFYYELNTVLLLCPGRFKVNYWELKLELGTNCSK